MLRLLLVLPAIPRAHLPPIHLRFSRPRSRRRVLPIPFPSFPARVGRRLGRRRTRRQTRLLRRLCVEATVASRATLALTPTTTSSSSAAAAAVSVYAQGVATAAVSTIAAVVSTGVGVSVSVGVAPSAAHNRCVNLVRGVSQRIEAQGGKRGEDESVCGEPGRSGLLGGLDTDAVGSEGKDKEHDRTSRCEGNSPRMRCF